MRNNIRFGVDEGNVVISQYGDKIAFPELQYDEMCPENKFETVYKLAQGSVFDLIGTDIIWTKKIPVEIKNIHRRFWGLKTIK